MNAKEEWIQLVENSLNDLQPAEVNPYLYSKIMSKLNNKIEAAPPKLVWTVAVSFVILFFLNVFILKSSQFNKAKNTTELQTLVDQYHLMNNNTFNYN